MFRKCLSKMLHAKNVTFSVKCSVFPLYSIEKCNCEVCNLYENKNETKWK